MDWLYPFMEDWGYWALFATMVLENMNIPIPSEVILGFAGFLVSRGIFDYWMAVLIGTLAGLVGSLASYALGYYGGRPLLLRYGDKVWLPRRKRQAADDWFHRYGGISVFTGRLLPGIRTFISLPAGMAKYPLRPFIWYTILGTIPWTMLLVWVGFQLGEHWEAMLEYDAEIIFASLCLAALIYVLHAWYRRYKNKKDGIHR